MIRKNITLPEDYLSKFASIRKYLVFNGFREDFNTSDSEIIREALDYFLINLKEGKVEVTAHVKRE